MHRFDRYLQRTGHYPRFRRRGVQCDVAPGYITISFKFQQIYISRSNLIPLLKWLIPLVKQMDRDFDPEQAMSEYLRREEIYDQGKRQLKKGRSRVPRHLRAVEDDEA